MMIFGVALANITHKLDSLGRRDGEGISSHVKLKEEGLACLKAMIEEAPASEYLKFLDAKDHAILLAYCLNLLCHYSKSDRSKDIRNFALEVMMSLMERLERIHGATELPTNCSIKPVVAALPGVSSTLFQLIMSDTKLPRSLLVNAIRNLSKLITMTFLSCKHQPQDSSESETQRVENICDNLSIRLNFLIDYTTNNAAELPDEMLIEVLELCYSIVSKSHSKLLSRSLGSIVKYLAFLSAEKKSTKSPKVKLKLILLTDCIREKVSQDCDDNYEKLDSVIISGIIKVLDNLETNAFLLLAKERQSELAILLGFLKLLPEESLTTFLEIDTRREQMINLLIRLSEFSASQPFLLLTDSEVSQDAVQISASKIYSIEKRFKHLTGVEINLIGDICHVVGSSSDWPSLNDILMNDLRNFSDPSNLHITHLILRALLHKNVDSVSARSISRFTAAMLAYYIDSIQTEFEADEVRSLKIVIAIESIATIVEIHLRFIANEPLRIIILKDLLCPLLKWASSGNRAISEAALSALTQISQLYECDSTKSLVEDNIDYIVNGVMQMLENFHQNSDVTHVLAITFKLSSVNSFYYFKDIFERLFRVLAIYQHSEKAQAILLLFYRTLATITDWNRAKKEQSLTGNPLKNEKILKTVIHELSIERRLNELAAKSKKAERYKQALDEIKDDPKPLDEAKVLEDVKSGNLPEGLMNNPEAAMETGDEKQEKKKQPDEIVLTERILTHCVSMMSSDHPEVKILALRTAALGFGILSEDENTLLPLVHKLWSPLEKRLVGDYGQNLEVSLCAFECLVSMAENAKDFIKRRTLDSIIPRICLFLETQAKESREQLDYGPYAMSVAYKCQVKILTQLGALAYHIDLAYRSLWRVVRTTLIYLNAQQMKSLRQAASSSLNYMIALDADCVWYFAKQAGYHGGDLPFDSVFQLTV